MKSSTTKICDKHKKTPALIYGQCVGCELDSLREQLKLVKSHAKSALDKLPERYNLGFQAGLKHGIPYEKELLDALANEKKLREDDNVAFTADIMKLEEEILRLNNLINDHSIKEN